MIALLTSLSWQEMFLLFIVGLLLFGRNLPDAGRKLGRVVAQLRRSLHDFKEQMDRDGEIRDVKNVISDTAREVRNVTRAPRAIANPGNALRELTHEAMTSPLPSTGPSDEGGDVADAVTEDEPMPDETDTTRPQNTGTDQP